MDRLVRSPICYPVPMNGVGDPNAGTPLVWFLLAADEQRTSAANDPLYGAVEWTMAPERRPQ